MMLFFFFCQPIPQLPQRLEEYLRTTTEVRYVVPPAYANVWVSDSGVGREKRPELVATALDGKWQVKDKVATLVPRKSEAERLRDSFLSGLLDANLNAEVDSILRRSDLRQLTKLLPEQYVDFTAPSLSAAELEAIGRWTGLREPIERVVFAAKATRSGISLRVIAIGIHLERSEQLCEIPLLVPPSEQQKKISLPDIDQPWKEWIYDRGPDQKAFPIALKWGTYPLAPLYARLESGLSDSGPHLVMWSPTLLDGETTDKKHPLLSAQASTQFTTAYDLLEADGVWIGRPRGLFWYAKDPTWGRVEATLAEPLDPVARGLNRACKLTELTLNSEGYDRYDRIFSVFLEKHSPFHPCGHDTELPVLRVWQSAGEIERALLLVGRRLRLDKVPSRFIWALDQACDDGVSSFVHEDYPLRAMLAGARQYLECAGEETEERRYNYEIPSTFATMGAEGATLDNLAGTLRRLARANKVSAQSLMQTMKITALTYRGVRFNVYDRTSAKLVAWFGLRLGPPLSTSAKLTEEEVLELKKLIGESSW